MTDTVTTPNGSEQLTAERIEVPEIGPRWIVTGQHGKVTYELLGNHLAYHFPDGDIDSAGRRWADQVQRHAKANADTVVFDFLAWHYEPMTNVVDGVTGGLNADHDPDRRQGGAR